MTHVTSGAALGYLIGRPLPALLVCAASHVPLDVAPHRDPASDIGLVADSILGAALISALARSRTARRLDPKRSALFGAIGAALPDVELLQRLSKEVDRSIYLFPTHNGKLPQMQAGRRASALLQWALVALSLALAAVKMKRELRRSSGLVESAG